MQTTNNAYVMVGMPGAGKSTYINNHLSGMLVLSTDKYIENYAKEYKITYNDAFAEKDMMRYANKFLNDQLRYASEQKVPVVWDQTNMSRKKRLNVIRRLRNAGYNHITVIEFMADKDTCKLRCKSREPFKVIPDTVIDNMYKRYQAVSWEEPFDDIIRVYE